MYNKLSDNWRTPEWLYKQLDEEFHFDIDLCATESNKKCEAWASDYLNDVYHWVGYPSDRLIQHCEINKITCFMNQPYSNPWPFITKAWEDSKYCKIVCLVKVDPSTAWWAVFWDYENHKPKPGCEVRFLPKRVKFDPPVSLDKVDCGACVGEGYVQELPIFLAAADQYEIEDYRIKCKRCKGEGKITPKAGSPNFASAIVIMDRRGE